MLANLCLKGLGGPLHAIPKLHHMRNVMLQDDTAVWHMQGSDALMCEEEPYSIEGFCQQEPELLLRLRMHAIHTDMCRDA